MRRDHNLPTESTLGAYIEGRLSAPEREAVEELLSRDNALMEELIIADKSISQPKEAPPEAVPEYMLRKAIALYPRARNLFDIVLRFVKGSLMALYKGQDIGLFSPQAAVCVRNSVVSSPTMVIITKSFEDMDIKVSFEKVGGRFCNIRLVVMNMSVKHHRGHLRADLMSMGRQLASDNIHDDAVLFEDIGPGKYSLKVHGDGRTYGELSVCIE
jgi:hypothetical protein